MLDGVEVRPPTGGWGKATLPSLLFCKRAWKGSSKAVKSHHDDRKTVSTFLSDVQRKDTARKHGCGPSQMGPPQTPSREEELVSTSNTPVESGKQRLYLLASTAPTTEQRLKH
ncbi:hypothetical protein V1264_016749 [Littorina saxatilis]|uniref:Uncharacterized protein n=1 Tax=Littorina saxatilis TaxID=31220 RepID=A0AAN9BFR5_9CAEN